MANEWVKALGMLYDYQPNEKYNQEDIDDVCCFLEGLEGIQPYVPEFVSEWIDESFENKEMSENIQYHWEMGELPQHIRKSDSERIQNLAHFVNEVLPTTDKSKWVATEKVDGTSTTWWKDEGNKLHVSTRNYEVELDGKYLEMAKKYNIENLLSANEWLQAEMIGKRIQSNRLQLPDNQLLVFNYHLNSSEKEDEIKRIMVPTYDLTMPDTVDGFIEQVNGIKSLVNPNVQAEGIVWTNVDGKEFHELSYRHNFKVINNTYLLKH